MASAVLEIQKCYETFKEQALDKNSESVAVWSKYKTDLKETKGLLNLLPKKVSHDVMVPIGPKALMRGKITHTNEFLVNLGDTWFVKRTAYQSIEICDRRIKTCDEMLEKLEKEKDLILNKTHLPTEQEAFGSKDRPEIVEYVTEEEHNEWFKQHRKKEKEYRRQLAELRNKEKKPIETEEDLWRHLDELELQEELEDELNRLNAESSEEDTEDHLEIDNNSDSASRDELVENCVQFKKGQKRKVSFACDENSSDDDPIVIHITHSRVEPVPSNSDMDVFNSPGDIYDKYLISFKKTPTSVLKKNVNPNKEKEFHTIKTLGSYYCDNESKVDEGETTIEVGLHCKDVCEKNSLTDKLSEPKREINRKVSKFKASKRNY